VADWNRIGIETFTKVSALVDTIIMT